MFSLKTKTAQNPIMKKTILSLAAAFSFSIAAFAQTPAAGAVGTTGSTIVSGAEITFDKDVHDFGNLKQGGDATCEFKFKNTGTDPLVISNARGSCGCTVPQWPQEPIKPGESSTIKVTYDSKRVGPINKSVTITSNAGNESTKVLRITGNIEAVPGQGDTPAFPVKEASPSAPVEKK